MSADGVDGNGIAPGSGGGRIAVIYDPVAQDAMPVPDVTFSAYGGTSYHETLQSNDGDIGTVYFPDARWFGGAYMPQVTGQLLFGAVPSEISFDSLVLSNAWVRFPRDVYRIMVSNDLFITGERGRLDVGSGGYFTGWGYWRLDNTSGEKNFLEIGGSLILTNGGSLKLISAPTNDLIDSYGLVADIAGDIDIARTHGFICNRALQRRYPIVKCSNC